MFIAFYKASKGNWLDAAINTFSGGRGYSHVELVFSDGVAFSSTSRPELQGRRDGVRFTSAIDFNSGNWDTLPILVSDEDEQFARTIARDIEANSTGYDFGAVLRFVMPLAEESPDKWMCSECVSAVLDAVGYLKLDRPAYKVSPNDLWLKFRGGE